MEPFYTLDELRSLQEEGKLTSVQAGPSGSQPHTSTNSFGDLYLYNNCLTNTNLVTGTYTTEQKEMLCKQVVRLFRNPVAKMMVETITQQNLESNGISSGDLLAQILSQRMSIDIFYLFEEQLVDMSTLGPCAAGRVIRLIQFLDMIK
jgi:hypothetical protein